MFKIMLLILVVCTSFTALAAEWDPRCVRLDTDMFYDPINTVQADALWQVYVHDEWYRTNFTPINESGLFRRTWINSQLNPSGAWGVQIPAITTQTTIVANRNVPPRIGRFFDSPEHILPRTLDEWRQAAAIDPRWSSYHATHQALIELPTGQPVLLSLAGDIPGGPSGSFQLQGEIITCPIHRAQEGVLYRYPLPDSVSVLSNEPIPPHLCAPEQVSSASSSQIEGPSRRGVSRAGWGSGGGGRRRNKI